MICINTQRKSVFIEVRFLWKSLMAVNIIYGYIICTNAMKLASPGMYGKISGFCNVYIIYIYIKFYYICRCIE
jgi:hypothetical protein